MREALIKTYIKLRNMLMELEAELISLGIEIEDINDHIHRK